MKTATKILGFSFLFQFITSFISGAFLLPTWLVPGDFGASMSRIAENPGLLRINILFDMLTAMGVIFLGVMLFIILRKQNEIMALTALSFYILEGTLLAGSRMNAFALLRFSQEFIQAGFSNDLLSMGRIAYESMDFVGNTLHMLVFCVGAILFYYLLFQSRVIPRWMSLWGLIAVFPCLIGTLLILFGNEVPFTLYLPYVPFEFVIGVWLLIKGGGSKIVAIPGN